MLLGPFVPSDNEADSGGFVSRANEEVGRMLRLPMEQFTKRREERDWQLFVDSYLAYRSRWYDEDRTNTPELISLDRRVLFVLSRGGTFALNGSQLVAIAAMHGSTNGAIVKKLSARAYDVERASIETAQALTEAQSRLEEDREGVLAFGRDVIRSMEGLALAGVSSFFAHDSVLENLDALAFAANLQLDELAIALATELPDVALEWFSRRNPEHRFANAESVSKALAKHELATAESRALLTFALKALEVSRDEEEKSASAPLPTPRSSQSPQSKTDDEVSRRVSAVKRVVGDTYGDGYIALCLAVLNYDEDEVASRLLDGDLPAELSHVDTGLGVGESVNKKNNNKNLEVDSEFAKAQKARVKALESQEEYDNKIYSMYDDDYDDRYDDAPDPVVEATALDAFTDQETTRKFNALRRAEEEEARYWEQNRNTNRDQKQQSSKAEEDDDEDEKKEEKKSGKVSGTNKAAASTSNKPAADKKKTMIQRKRAEKNKAAVANHNRKDRATKKASF